jgi:hypothetical protein
MIRWPLSRMLSTIPGNCARTLCSGFPESVPGQDRRCCHLEAPHCISFVTIDPKYSQGRLADAEHRPWLSAARERPAVRHGQPDHQRCSFELGDAGEPVDPAAADCHDSVPAEVPHLAAGRNVILLSPSSELRCVCLRALPRRSFY